LEVEEF